MITVIKEKNLITILIISYLMILISRTKEKRILREIIIMEDKEVMIRLMCITIIILIIKIKEINTTEKEKITNLWLEQLLIILIIIIFSITRKLTYFILIESTLYPIRMLILKYSKEKDKISALKFMIYLNSLGSIPFIGWLSQRKKWNKQDKMIIEEITIIKENRTIIIGIRLMVIIIKIPIVMAHFWLTKAHVSAAGTNSILLARIIIKIGTIGILKITPEFQNPSLKIIEITIRWRTWRRLIIIISIIRFYDLKIQVAISSVLHICIIIFISLMNQENSTIAVVLIARTHGTISFIIFLLVSNIYEGSKRRRQISTRKRECLEKNIRISWTVYSLINMGIPPLGNFIREIIILRRLAKIKSLTNQLMILIRLIIIVSYTIILIKTTKGKKEIKENQRINSKSLVVRVLCFYVTLTLSKICYYSLKKKKILLCGGKEENSNNHKKNISYNGNSKNNNNSWNNTNKTKNNIRTKDTRNKTNKKMKLRTISNPRLDLLQIHDNAINSNNNRKILLRSLHAAVQF